VDVLITHWPPFGILDQISHKEKGGSKGLLEFVRAIKPKIHIFGHIHEKRGHIKEFGI
jgi:Icc-related predicted phosphoesterase